MRYANAAGREGRFDIRHFFNGLVDSYLYHSGRVDTTLPFDELRRRSLINEAAQAADGAPTSRSAFAQPCRRSRADTPPAPVRLPAEAGRARRPTGELTHDPAQFE